MSTSTSSPATDMAASEPRARFRDLVTTEWIKLWSLRSSAWALAISALAIVGFNANAAYDDYLHWPAWDARTRAEFVPKWAMTDAFTAGAGLGLMLAVSAIGAIVILGEYGTGLIRTTFTAIPARRSVMAAKLVVVAAVTTGFGAVVAAASFGLTQAILAGRGAGLSIGDPGALRTVVASALLAPVAALAGLALGAVIRHGAVTMVVCVVLLLLLPVSVGDDRYGTALISHATPYHAWLRLVRAGEWQVAHPWTLTGAWTVYAIWALAAAVLAVAAVHRRDL